MTNLIKIGKSMYGTKYAFAGAIPFSFPDLSALKYGDVVVDNNGKGIQLCINQCSECQKKLLGGMLAIGLVCKECERCQLLGDNEKLWRE